MKPGDLIPYPANAKLHPPAQVDHIANSIKAFGWQQPIVVDSENVVIIGHGRLMAAKQLMLDTVPVVRATDLTEDQVNALRLADNKTNESEWDFGKLEEELAQLAIDGVDMGLFGFDDTTNETEPAKSVELKENYQLIIDCENEADMEEKYNQLQEMGIECRTSTL
jgi:site-specific DNA-methyltransferase (adenine-specific)